MKISKVFDNKVTRFSMDNFSVMIELSQPPYSAKRVDIKWANRIIHTVYGETFVFALEGAIENFKKTPYCPDNFDKHFEGMIEYVRQME